MDPSHLFCLSSHLILRWAGPLTCSILLNSKRLHPGGSAVSVLDSSPGGCEFDPWLKRTFFPAYFPLSPLQKHVGKVVGSFGKKSCVSTGARK